MSNRFLFMWWLFILLGTCLCQYFKNTLIILICVSVIVGSIIVFFFDRLKFYREKNISKYKLILSYEIITMIIVSLSLMMLGIFYFNKNTEVYFWIYLLHVFPLIPIIMITAWINIKSKK
jgi:hypothetical protein